MKTLSGIRLGVVLAIHLGVASWWATPCMGAPTITSVNVQPPALVPGQAFAVEVSASADVTQGIVTVDFRPWAASILRLTLTQQGSLWVATGVVPSNLQPAPGAQATITALVFDAVRQRAQSTLKSGVFSLSSAFFDTTSGILTIIGDQFDNTLVIGRDVAGNLFVNGGSILIQGGAPTITNTKLVRALGLDGNDQIAIDTTGGEMPPAQFFGGNGDDVLTGGFAADQLFGGPGNDTLRGSRGDDSLFGGSGDDNFSWNPGDGSDLIEGGEGQDTLEFNGANANEVIQLSSVGSRIRLFRNVANITMDIGGTERIIVRALGGTDTLDASGVAAGQVSLFLDGGADADTLIGSAGDDTLSGGRGDDVILAGAGNDTILWNPGDGNDTVEGQAGQDTLVFNGSNVSERIDVSANGGRVRFFRDVGNITMDLNDVEHVLFNAVGGADTVTVNDLSGTDLTAVDVDLSGTPGTGVGDGQADAVVVNGTAGPDNITLVTSADSIAISGLAATVNVKGTDPANDVITVNGLAGSDVLNASGLPAGLVRLVLDGGLDPDFLVGSPGNDTLIGGRGDDAVLAGAGDDAMVWNPGDGSDILEGQAGFDTLVFNGANVSENITLLANGGRVRFLRDVATISMDLNDVERVRFNALGGADRITVNDLTGTDVTEVALDLAAPPGSGIGDGSADLITVNGTTGDDVISVSGSGSDVLVLGLATLVHISGSEAALDRILVQAQGGEDVVDAATLPSGVTSLTIDGGDGDDVLIGSDGDDVIFGGNGDDVLLGGPGTDVLDGGSGDNIVIQ